MYPFFKKKKQIYEKLIKQTEIIFAIGNVPHETRRMLEISNQVGKEIATSDKGSQFDHGFLNEFKKLNSKLKITLSEEVIHLTFFPHSFAVKVKSGACYIIGQWY